MKHFDRTLRRQNPSLPDAAPRSYRPRCAGRESTFLADIVIFVGDHGYHTGGSGVRRDVLFGVGDYRESIAILLGIKLQPRNCV